MIFMLDGENLKIITPVCTEKKKIGSLFMVLDQKQKWLPGWKFYSCGDQTRNTDNTRCFDVAFKVSLV
jgi:hypothetical protein